MPLSAIEWLRVQQLFVQQTGARMSGDSAPAKHNTAAHIYRLIHDVYLLLDATDRSALDPFGLTTTQYRVLTLLDAAEGRRLIDLSEWLFCARSTITRIVDYLEAMGWVGRVGDPDDRRAQRVALTDSGVELRQRVAAAHTAALETSLGTLGVEDGEALDSLLQKVTSGLQAYLDLKKYVTSGRKVYQT
jgi:DNA-binding MarR family transcriptional regulator